MGRGWISAPGSAWGGRGLVKVPPGSLLDGGSTHSSSRRAVRGIAALNPGWGVQQV